MKKSILALSISVLASVPAIAADSKTMADYDLNDRSGFAIRAGLTGTAGDLGNGETNNGIAFGASYTMENGIIIGANYAPTIAEDSAYAYGLEATVEIANFVPYVGYQFHNGFKLTGGIPFAMADATVSDYYGNTVSDSEIYNGFAVGVGYDFDHLTLDAQWSFIDVEGLSGVNANLLVGYKF